MKIEKQVCGLDQAKRLKELGVAQQSVFYWMTHEKLEPQIRYSSDFRDTVLEEEDWFSAFTVAELGVMLRNLASHAIYCPYPQDDFQVNVDGDIGQRYFKTEAEARAAILIYLLENNHITADEVNQRLQQ